MIRHPVRAARRVPALERLALLAVTALAFALRVHHLGYMELRGDESLGRLFSMQPAPDLIRATIALKEPHPVASYIVQGAWLNVAGHTEFALRFVSTWFGVLAVPLLYALARRLGLSKLTSGVAAALLAISPYAIWHSQDARMYSISLALTLASTVLMLVALSGNRSLAWAGYIAVTWLALQTHYYAAYIVIVQNLFVIGRAAVDRTERRRLVPWLVAQAITALLYLPWLYVARETLTGYTGNGDSPGFAAMWSRSLGVFAVGETLPLAQRTAAAVLAAVLALLGGFRLAASGSPGRRALWLSALYLVVPLLITWVGALNRPIFNERYIIAALPGFALLVASGASLRSPIAVPSPPKSVRLSGWAGAALGALLAGSMIISLGNMYYDPAYRKSPGWRQLVATMRRFAHAAPSDAIRIAQGFPDPTMWYYYDEPVDHVVMPPAALDEPGAARLARDLAADDVRRVILAEIPSPNWDNRKIGPRALQTIYALSAEVPAHNWTVQVYDLPPERLAAVDASFANGIALSGGSVGLEQLFPGDALPVWLRWTGETAALTGSEKITLQLLDSNGALVAQTDRPFGVADFEADAAAYVVPLPETLPPGNYRLIVAVYNPGEDGAPRLLTVTGQDHVELATLTAPAR